MNQRQQKMQQIEDGFDDHADAAVHLGLHHPLEHGCHHRASACAVLPRRPSWLTNSLKQHKTLTKQKF